MWCQETCSCSDYEILCEDTLLFALNIQRVRNFWKCSQAKHKQDWMQNYIKETIDKELP
jgi:hypothetical protein